MKSKHMLFLMYSPFIIMIALSLVPGINANFPPTDAFSKVIVGGQSIEATTYNSNFTIVTQGDITTSTNGNTIFIKLVQKSCDPLNVIIGIDANGNFICGVP